VTQVSPPPRGQTVGDPEIFCTVGDIITFIMPVALPGHPFLIIDEIGNQYPGAPPQFTSGSIQFQCSNMMLTTQAYYTCTIHGGAAGAPMTGKITARPAPPSSQNFPTPPPAPTSFPSEAPTPEPTPPTTAPPPGVVNYDITCPTSTRSCAVNPRRYTVTPRPQGSDQLDGPVFCKDGDTIRFNFPQALGAAHPFNIIDNAGNKYPGIDGRYPFQDQGELTFKCDAAQLNSNPAFYTCVNHGGMPNQPMTGPILIAGNPTAGPGPVSVPTRPTRPTKPTTGTSICDKYSQALKLTNLQLVQAIVDSTVRKVLQNPVTRPFFTGVQPPNTTNYETNARAAMSLAGRLVRFFAPPLGCSDDTIDPYVEGQDRRKRFTMESFSLASIHKPLGIGQAAFDQFNQELINVLRESGVAQTDQDTVLMILNSLKDQIVADVPNQTPTANDPSFGSPHASPVGLIIAVVIIAVLGALLLGGIFAGIVYNISGGSFERQRGADDYDLL